MIEFDEITILFRPVFGIGYWKKINEGDTNKTQWNIILPLLVIEFVYIKKND